MTNSEELNKYIELLKSDNKRDRCAGAKALAEFNTSDVKELLVQVLQDKNNEVREIAAYSLEKLNWQSNNNYERTFFLIAKKDWETLSNLENPEIEPLLFALTDNHVYARRCAALCLSKMKDPALIRILIEALDDTDSFVQKHIFHGLEESEDYVTTQAIVGCLSHSIKEVRERAADILLLKDWYPSNTDEELSLMFAKKEFIKMANVGAEGIKKLYLALEDENDEIVWLAIEALNEIHNPESMQYILKNIKNDKSNRKNLIRIFLKHMQKINTIEPFITYLLDEERDIRILYFKLLQRINWKPKNNEEKICYFIAKEDWKSLSNFGDEAVAFLLKALECDTNQIRISIVKTLGIIGNENTFSQLTGLLSDSNSEISYEASLALDKIGWQPQTSRDYVQYAIAFRKWNLLVESGEELIKPFTEILNSHGNFQHKKEILKILKENKNFNSKPLLQIASRDSNKWIRKLTLQILDEKGVKVETLNFINIREKEVEIGNQNDEIAHSTVLQENELVKDLLHSDYSKRRKAANELIHQNWKPETFEDNVIFNVATQNWNQLNKWGKRTIETLGKSLQVDNVLIRRKIVNLIAQHKNEQSRSELVRALQDEDIWVRRIASKALKEFEDIEETSNLD